MEFERGKVVVRGKFRNRQIIGCGNRYVLETAFPVVGGTIPVIAANNN